MLHRTMMMASLYNVHWLKMITVKITEMSILSSSGRMGGVAANRPFLGMDRVGGALFRLAESLVDPLALLVSLFALMFWFRDDQFAHYAVLGVILFYISF